MSYTGQEHEDLKLALALLKAETYPTFKDLPDTMVNIAVGGSVSDELSTTEIVKEWLRRAENETVQWYALSRETWEFLSWTLQIEPDSDYATSNPDSGVVFVKSREYIRFLRRDLGGEDFGKLPLRAAYVADHRTMQWNEPSTIWFSRDPGALIEAVEVSLAEWKSADGVRFTVLSPNAVTLILHRLSHPVPAQAEQPAVEEQDAQEATG